MALKSSNFFKYCFSLLLFSGFLVIGMSAQAQQVSPTMISLAFSGERAAAEVAVRSIPEHQSGDSVPSEMDMPKPLRQEANGPPRALTAGVSLQDGAQHSPR